MNLAQISSLVDFLFFHLFGPIQDPPIFEVGQHCYSNQDERFGSEVEQEEDTYFLVDDLKTEGPCKHHDPSYDVNSRNDQFVLIVMPEILHIHGSWIPFFDLIYQK